MVWAMSFFSIHPNMWCKHHGWGTKGVVFYYCCLCSLGASTISPSSHRSHARLHQSGSIVGLRNFLCRANGQWSYSSWLARSGSLLILPIILWCKEHLDQGENRVSAKSSFFLKFLVHPFRFVNVSDQSFERFLDVSINIASNIHNIFSGLKKVVSTFLTKFVGTETKHTKKLYVHILNSLTRIVSTKKKELQAIWTTNLTK